MGWAAAFVQNDAQAAQQQGRRIANQLRPSIDRLARLPPGPARQGLLTLPPSAMDDRPAGQSWPCPLPRSEQWPPGLCWRQDGDRRRARGQQGRRSARVPRHLAALPGARHAQRAGASIVSRRSIRSPKATAPAGTGGPARTAGPPGSRLPWGGPPLSPLKGQQALDPIPERDAARRRRRGPRRRRQGPGAPGRRSGPARAAQARRPARRGRGGRARLHALPQGAPRQDPLDQSARACQRRDQAPHRSAASWPRLLWRSEQRPPGL